MTAGLSHLRELEAESIHIIREVAATFERPVLLFSGGKDSIVMLRLAEKAFWPCKLPFPVMHVDTGTAGSPRRDAGWWSRPCRTTSMPAGFAS